MDLKISNHDDLFKDIPSEITVWASHNDEVKRVPDNFEIIASSPTCPVEAVRCKDRPIYAVQFHPEVEHTEYGAEMFQNFLNIIAEYKK